jgi:hypothetical protein
MICGAIQFLPQFNYKSISDSMMYWKGSGCCLFLSKTRNLPGKIRQIPEHFTIGKDSRSSMK